MLYSLSSITKSSSSVAATPPPTDADADVAALRGWGEGGAAGLGGGRRPPEMKSLISLGVAVSNPARLSVLRSFGSAIVRQFDVIPTTMSLASIPVAARYCSKAACGWILPMYVSLSV